MGSIKARLEHIDTKTAETTGFVSAARLTDMAIGANMLVLSVLLATVVKIIVERPKARSNTMLDFSPTAVAKFWPIQLASPRAHKC